MIPSDRSNIRAATEDLKNHSLQGFRDEVSRLVYLASTRDYNTGRYYHEGLALHYTCEVANRALAFCHEQSFRKILEISLEELVSQLQTYLLTHECGANEVLNNWLTFEVYRVVVPYPCDPLSANFFNSNFKVALAILAFRAKSRPS